MLDVIRDTFELSPERMRCEIRKMHLVTVEAIAAKGIDYRKLDKALTPQRNRLELALLFDTARISTGAYGFAVAKIVLPLLHLNLSASIQLGDLILERDLQDHGIELLNRHAKLMRSVGVVDTNQIYCVYINNLTPKMASDIVQGVARYEPFIGYVDASTSSPMKDWLSISLVNGYLKHGPVMLNGHEDDVPNTEDYNLKGWPLEERGYLCRSIQDMYFHLFLGYKIERRVVAGAESDTDFALTAISGRPLPFSELDVQVAEAKSTYLREQHGSSLSRAGLHELSDEELIATIKAKINDSYIYNLRYEASHETSLFNIIIEVSVPELSGGAKTTRLLASLAYEPHECRLRLVTLF